MKLLKLMLLGSALILTACATQKNKSDMKVATIDAPTKYKKLVYGAEMPLVCTTPFPAEGKLKDRPNLQLMWENYLYDRPEGIWGEIGGLVEVNGNLPFDQGRWTNACSVRLSHMLNKADHKIPRESKKTVSGGNKDQYYYRVADMEAYLVKTLGEPDVAILDGSGNSFDLPPSPGIVLMDFPDSSFTGHTTVWNGAGTVDGAEIGGYRVLFWDLPCFVPEGRDEMLASKPTASLETIASLSP
ncbi:MAG: T6SS effector amidase Tae4 family protein [Alphaproteobacteria bacterium]